MKSQSMSCSSAVSLSVSCLSPSCPLTNSTLVGGLWSMSFMPTIGYPIGSYRKRIFSWNSSSEQKCLQIFSCRVCSYPWECEGEWIDFGVRVLHNGLTSEFFTVNHIAPRLFNWFWCSWFGADKANAQCGYDQANCEFHFAVIVWDLNS